MPHQESLNTSRQPVGEEVTARKQYLILKTHLSSPLYCYIYC